jgi:uncharacterized protein
MQSTLRQMAKERPPLEEMTLRQLRRVASEYGVSRYSRMRKSQLLASIQEIETSQDLYSPSRNIEAQEAVEATKFELGQEDRMGGILAAVDEDLADLPAGYGESVIVLMPRDPEWAYAYWDIPNNHKEELRALGGQQLALRIYDVTAINLDRQSPHSIQEYLCDELAREWYIPIPVSDRDYVVDIGYRTADGRWLVLARSLEVHVPPIYPSDWIEDQFMTIGWEEELQGKTFAELAPPTRKIAVLEREIYNQMFDLGDSTEARVAGSLFGSMQHVPGSVSEVPGSAQMVMGSVHLVPGSAQMLAEEAISSYVFPSGVGKWAVPTVSGLTESGVGLASGSGVGLASGSGVGLASGSGAGLLSGSGAGLASGSGAGFLSGSGAGFLSGSGAGLASGSGAGLASASGVGLLSGSGAGLLSASGAGFLSGSGAGLLSGSGAGLASGSGAGLLSGSGAGFLSGSGAGLASGSGAGLLSGSGAGFLSGSGAGLASGSGMGMMSGVGFLSGSGAGLASGSGMGMMSGAGFLSGSGAGFLSGSGAGLASGSGMGMMSGAGFLSGSGAGFLSGSGVGMMSGAGLASGSGVGMMSGAGFLSGSGAGFLSGSGAGLASGSGAGMSGVGFSGSIPVTGPRKFWLVADAELIVYGATEPDAKVYIGGQEIKINPDGTFRFQMSFQDGLIDYPIFAIAADGEQNRAIHLKFTRETPERRTNTKEEAVLEWPG